MLPRGTLSTVTLALATLALLGLASAAQADSTEPHDRIFLNGDDEAHANACACIANPQAAGTASDPYIIEGWRIEEDDGTGIDIRNMDAVHILVRDNAIETPNGIHLHDTGTRVDLYRNNIDYEASFGIKLKDSSPDAVENVIHGWIDICTCPRGVGISADGSAPWIEGNVISETGQGIYATAATPHILDNELFENRNAIVLEDSAEAEITGNLIRISKSWGITLTSSSQAVVTDNDIRQGKGGVLAEHAEKLTLASNTLTNIDGDAVTFVKTHVTMTNNEVSHNWHGAVGARSSDILIQDNTFHNNGKDAVTLRDTSGTVDANILTKNQGVGIAIKQSILEITDNRLENNTYGFSIPYESRQTIERMSGNLVNGVNVDGTINPNEQRLFNKQVNVQIQDETIDSGHGDGYFGLHTKQGALVLYNITGASIEGNVFANQTASGGHGRAVYVVSSFNVNVTGNLFENNHEGLLAIDTRAFVKDNVCEIDIDPPETLCIEARGGYMDAEDNTLSIVDIGIRYGVSPFTGEIADGTIRSNIILDTASIGIHLAGEFSNAPIDVLVEANTLQDGQDGILASHMLGPIRTNDITDNEGAGIVLTGRSDATFTQNLIEANHDGILDTGTCTPTYTVKCSSGTLTDNTIQSNQNIGVRIHDGATFNQDTIHKNALGLDLLGTTHLDDVTLTQNKLAIDAHGTLTIHETTLQNNDEGIRHDGTLTLEDTTLTDTNGPALAATGHATITRSTVSDNDQRAITVDGTLTGTDSTVNDNQATGIHVDGTATLENITANRNQGDGIHIQGTATLHQTITDQNQHAGIHLAGDTLTITECHTRANEHGILIEPHAINADQDLFLAHLNILQLPQEPILTQVRVDACHLTGNTAFALEAATDALVEAQRNYWGEDGPIYNMPFHRTPNTVSNHVIVTPYWQDEDQTQPGFVPTTELDPSLFTPTSMLP